MSCTKSTLDLRRKFEEHFELGATIGDGSFARVCAVRRLGAGAKPVWVSESCPGGCEEPVVKPGDLGGREPGSRDKVIKPVAINNQRRMALIELAIRDKIGKPGHCVSLHEVFVYQKRVYMVSERCPRSLSTELADRPMMSEVEVGYWFRQMFAGIAHLYFSGIVHRGVCAKQILLGVDGKTKLKDFSRAIILPKNSTMVDEEKSCIWAIGELLDGRLLFPNGSEVSQGISRTPSFVNTVHCKTSLSEYPSMEQFVKSLLQPIPENRPYAADAFLAIRHPESMAVNSASISSAGRPKLLLPVEAVLQRSPIEEDEDEPFPPSRRRASSAVVWDISDTESIIDSSQASTTDLSGDEADNDFDSSQASTTDLSGDENDNDF